MSYSQSSKLICVYLKVSQEQKQQAVMGKGKKEFTRTFQELAQVSS